MDGKITLITPPDIFENNNTSVLFVHLSDSDQDIVSQWLAKSSIDVDINLYVYAGEPNISWLLYAMARCQHKYIDFDGVNLITQALGGYILGRPGVHYRTSDDNLAEVYSHINQNRATSIEKFLEMILGN